MLIKSKDSFKIRAQVSTIFFDVKVVETYKDFVYLKSARSPLNYFNRHRLWNSIQHVDEGHNLVVNAGLDQICNLILAINTSSFTHCAAGSDGTAAAAGQTALLAQLGSRNAVTSRYLVSTGIAHFDTFFASGDAAGTWLEVALFTAAASGTMLCRKVISSFVKSASNSAVVAWTVTFTAV